MKKPDAMPISDQTKADELPGSDCVAQLCERIRQAADEAGQESLRAVQQQADALLEDARSRAKAETQAELKRVEEQLQKEVSRKLQNARLEARARLARFRWSELDLVLEEAEQELDRVRQHQTQRYAAALMRLFEAARDWLPPQQLVIRTNPDDISLLREQLPREGPACEFIEDNSVRHGLVVTTANGNIVCDQSMTRRRQRHDHELRLAAAEILFSDEHTPSKLGESK